MLNRAFTVIFLGCLAVAYIIKKGKFTLEPQAAHMTRV